MPDRIYSIDQIDGFKDGDGSPESPFVDSAMNRQQAIESILEKAPNCPQEIIERQELAEVVYYSFDGKVHKGQIVVDKELVSDVQSIFQTAFEHKFPIARVIPISFFNWDDESSMAAVNNNSSGFNYRNVLNPASGEPTISEHGYGRAIDLNPLQNPWVKEDFPNQPADGVYDPHTVGTLTAEHPIVLKAKELGWEWGGEWKPPYARDNQHFEKPVPKQAKKSD